MGKAQKQNKKGKKERRPNIPATTSLRPGLSRLLTEAPAADDQVLVATIERLRQGVKDDVFLQALLASHVAAPQGMRDWLDDVLPNWLREHEMLDLLRTMVAREAFPVDQEQEALAWLESAGVDISDLVELAQRDPFYRAFMFGNEMQGALLIFWYANRQQTRVRGFSFLIDFQPPWNGSVKDVIYFPQRTPDAAMADFIAPWQQRAAMNEADLLELDAVDAKQRALTALLHNRQENIRLPADLIPHREPFARYVLALPDGPETPAFGVEDFDTLSRQGQTPEMLIRHERQFGYRTRLPNGEEMLLLRDPDDN